MNGCQVIGRPSRPLVDGRGAPGKGHDPGQSEPHVPQTLVQERAPKRWRARADDDQVGIPLSSTLGDLSLWPPFTGEHFRIGNVA